MVVNFAISLPWLSRSASPGSGVETSLSTTSSLPTLGVFTYDNSSIERTTNHSIERLVTPARSKSSAHTTRFPSPTLTITLGSSTRISSSIASARSIGSVLVHSPQTRPGGYSPWWAFYRRSSSVPRKIRRRALWTKRRSEFVKKKKKKGPKGCMICTKRHLRALVWDVIIKFGSGQ